MKLTGYTYKQKLGKSVAVAAVCIVTCSCSDMSCYIMSCIWERDNEGFRSRTDTVCVQVCPMQLGTGAFIDIFPYELFWNAVALQYLLNGGTISVSTFLIDKINVLFL
jgi:hypothetical protein